MNKLEKILVGAVLVGASLTGYKLTHSYRPPEIRTIDVQSADAGNEKVQDQWIEFFNKQGKDMMSAPDLYLAGKTGSDELLKILQKDFSKGGGVITSTRLFYNADGLNSKIIHDYGSTVTRPTKTSVLIPVDRRAQLNKVLGTKEGLRYVRTLFNTQDSAEDIVRTLERLSRIDPDHIVFYTPTQEYRGIGKETAAHFIYDFGTFTIDLFSTRCDEFGRGMAHGATPKK